MTLIHLCVHVFVDALKYLFEIGLVLCHAIAALTKPLH